MDIQEKHHRKSIRLKGFDYRDGGTYFVTICTKNKERLLGEIQNGMMGLSEIGCIVADELQKTPIIRPYVDLDRWCIMPNHVHFILYIHPDNCDCCRGMARHAPTERHFAKPIAGSLPTIIGAFKSAVTKKINEQRDGDTSIWQRNYYEHIIRDPDERLRIRKYILDNPLHWDTDPENV
jgi:REP element-mobilizing transposase RayT